MGCPSEATDGAPTCFSADVVATAKRDLRAGEILDGEGGYCVWGRQTPADVSLREGYLPLGLAQRVMLTRDVAMGFGGLAGTDVTFDPTDPVVRLRREMEAAFSTGAT